MADVQIKCSVNLVEFGNCSGENTGTAATFTAYPTYECLKHYHPIYPQHYYLQEHHHHHRQQQQQQQQQQQLPDELRRRSRNNFSGFQLDMLERAFASGHYPDSAKVTELSYLLCISESRVQVSRRSLEVA